LGRPAKAGEEYVNAVRNTPGLLQPIALQRYRRTLLAERRARIVPRAVTQTGRTDACCALRMNSADRRCQKMPSADIYGQPSPALIYLKRSGDPHWKTG
jgi:hypothetical protein